MEDIQPPVLLVVLAAVDFLIAALEAQVIHQTHLHHRVITEPLE
jgi:hypothetical protein